MFSTRDNIGQYSSLELAFGDTNGWQAGDLATHPIGTTSTSFDALDAVVSHLSNQTQYPNLSNITLVGHGGGGQLLQRYAAVGPDPSPHIHVRYVVGDPSSSAYFTSDRASGIKKTGTKSSCPDYNIWRYGYE